MKSSEGKVLKKNTSKDNDTSTNTSFQSIGVYCREVPCLACLLKLGASRPAISCRGPLTSDKDGFVRDDSGNPIYARQGIANRRKLLGLN